MSQKPPDLDNNGKPLDNSKPPDILDDIPDPVVYAKKFLANTPDIKDDTATSSSSDKGWLANLWEKANKPLTDLPSKLGDAAAKNELSFDPVSPMIDKFLGDFATNLTSPLGLATTAATMGEGAAAKFGLQGVAKGLNLVSRGLSAPVAAEGAYNAYEKPTLMGKIGGGLQALLGALGMMHSPISAKVESEIPKPDIFSDIPDLTGRSILTGERVREMLKVEPKEALDRGWIIRDDSQGSSGYRIVQNNPELANHVDINTGELFDTPVSAKPPDIPDTAPTRIQSPLELYQNYRKESKTAGIKPLEYNKWNDSGRPSVNGVTPPTASGTPQFNRKGKTGETGNMQSDANMASIKPGEMELSQVQDLASQGYKFSHVADDGSYTFAKTGEPFVPESSVGQSRPTPSTARQQMGPQTDSAKKSIAAEILNLPRAIMASTDMSAPLRQGLPLIHKKQFWQTIPDMFRAFGSEEAFNAIQQNIAEKPLFKLRVGPGGKQLPSFAQDAGLKLTDLHDLSKREEALMSSWAEKIPVFGSQVYRRSERAYTAFLNKLRADTFESLITSGKVIGADGTTNAPLARGLADFVNTATGRGSLGALEKSAVALNSTFFAPRLIASRLKMLNPVYYITAEPMVRKEALKSLFAVAAFGNTLGQLAKMAGADVESDPVSSDFGKIKVGNTRLDPFAGFQQYIVAANRLVQGRTKSSTTGNEYNLGEKFGRQTRLDVLARFGESKLNPVITLAMDILRGKDFTGQPTNIPEEVASRFVPILIQDIKQLATENPNLLPNIAGLHGESNSYDEFHPENLPFAIPSWFGMGVQSYKSK